jgi:alpha-tubulin suppressor-like RCC1 family protein
MNLERLETAINEQISASSSEYELLVYTKILQTIRTGAVWVVATPASLPQASLNAGKLYFVESIETLVYSDGVSWVRAFTAKEIQAFAWGLNSSGQLGDNTTVTKSSPVQEITSSTNWCKLSDGIVHTSALKTDGTLWSWGAGACGRLGNNATTNRSSPVQEITLSTNWCTVSAGFEHTGAIKTDGTLWTWGESAGGRLGNNTTATDRSSPVQEITSSTNWCQISSGFCHTGAVKTDGSLWAWGSGICGRLGDGTTTQRASPVREVTSSTNWCRVSANNLHSAALKTDGTIWAWGSNNCGQLGDNATAIRCSPVQEITSSTNWCDVSTSCFGVFAIKMDGSLWGWGSNLCGVLGNNNTAFTRSPVQEITSSTNWCEVAGGALHTGAIKADGTIWTWGLNNCGQLGTGDLTTRSSPVQEVTSSTNWCYVSVGTCHTLGLKYRDIGG